MSANPLPAANRLRLTGVDWSTYARLLRLFDERRRLRITYDRGVLEIMTLSPRHERIKHRLGLLVLALAEGMGIAVAGFGSMTFRRRGRRRGLEPDECFWIQHEVQVRGRDQIDLRRDPPPDLVIEVDIARSSLNRLDIYGVLRVPEIWRFDGKNLAFLARQADGSYATCSHSLAFPRVTPADLAGFLALRGQLDETAIVKQARAWAAQQPTP
ncbi:MAG: Uma2 family endonuclease [Planctomycetia bacterium]|nr:Uma2 family endonuclease [Planctomycetia bacterium]